MCLYVCVCVCERERERERERQREMCVSMNVTLNVYSLQTVGYKWILIANTKL